LPGPGHAAFWLPGRPRVAPAQASPAAGSAFGGKFAAEDPWRMHSNQFHICVLPGDGIGNEVMDPCMRILRKACERIGGVALAGETAPAGVACYQTLGTALPKSTMDLARRS